MRNWFPLLRACRCGPRGAGAASPFILCHGGPGLWDYLAPVAAAVDDVAEVVRYDQRGCGRSTGNGPYTLDNHVEDLESVRRWLGCDSWVVGGHSWGATLALAYAWSHPRRVLVYVSGTGLAQQWRAAYHAEATRRRGASGAARLAALKGRPRTEQEEREYRVLSWAPDFADRSRAFELAASLDAPYPINGAANRALNDEMKSWSEADLVAACDRIKAPALVVHGGEDPRPSWAIGSLVQPLPDIELVLMEGAGHLPWIEGYDCFAAVLQLLPSPGSRPRVGPAFRTAYERP